MGKFKNFWNNLTKKNLKFFVRLTTVILAITLIIIMSLANVGLNIEKINWQTWISNSLLLGGIVMLFQILFEGIGEDYFRGNIDGAFQKSIQRYDETYIRIKNEKEYLPQFLIWYQKEEYRNARIKLLRQVGLYVEAEDIVDNFKKQDIELLKNRPAILYGKSYDQLNPSQYEMCRYVFGLQHFNKKGKTKEKILEIDTMSSEYLLEKHKQRSEISPLNEKKALIKRAKINKLSSRTLKIIMGLIISIIWSSFTINEFISGDNTEAIMNLLTRIFAAISGSLSGIMTASITIKIYAEIIDNKSLILDKFFTSMEKGNFVPLTKEEWNKQRVEEYEKELAEEETRRQKEQEEALKNLVSDEEAKIINEQLLLENNTNTLQKK